MTAKESQITWERMCAAIKEEFSKVKGEPNIDHLRECMQAYTSNISDWGKYNMFDPQRIRYRSFGFLTSVTSKAFTHCALALER